MKKTVLGLTAAGVLLLAPLSPVAATPLIKIEYQVIDLPNTSAGDVRQYQYQVDQFNFPSGGGFDIFFDLDDGYLAGDLLEPLLPPNPDWSVLALQPDPLLPDDGRYDADARARVDNPSLNGCFTQTFVWHGGQRTPGTQQFEVFDAAFQVQASGTTTPASFTCPAVVAAPEPGMLWLLGLGLLGVVWSRTKGRYRFFPSLKRRGKQQSLLLAACKQGRGV